MANLASFRGGVRIGWVNASWPFASLTSTSETLTLKVLVFGTYTFRPEDIVRIERMTILPIVAWGVRIHHVKAGYPENIIFWSLSSPEGVLRGISESGFQPKSSPSVPGPSRTWPVRWQSIVLGIVMWNALIGFDLWRTRKPGYGAMIALGLIFFMSTAIWWLPAVRWAVMKPGRRPEEIRHWLRLLTLVSGFMLAMFGLMFFKGPMGPR